MNYLRNVRDAEPVGLSRTRVDAFALRVADGLGLVPGAPLTPVFERLGGTFLEVASTFGRQGDRILVQGLRSLTFEGVGHWDGTRLAPDPFELAESLGCLFLHYPGARARHGEDVALAVPRITPPGPAQIVLRELVWFAAGLLMPAEAFRAAHAEDPDPAALARRFGIDRSNAEARCNALGLVPGGRLAAA